MINAKRQLYLDLAIMLGTCTSYSICSQGDKECVSRVGPWLELFIFYQAGVSFVNLACVFLVQNHMIEQMGLAERTVYEERKSLTAFKFCVSLFLVYIMIVGN